MLGGARCWVLGSSSVQCTTMRALGLEDSWRSVVYRLASPRPCAFHLRPSYPSLPPSLPRFHPSACLRVILILSYTSMQICQTRHTTHDARHFTRPCSCPHIPYPISTHYAFRIIVSCARGPNSSLSCPSSTLSSLPPLPTLLSLMVPY